jgi:hypothetical protein
MDIRNEITGDIIYSIAHQNMRTLLNNRGKSSQNLYVNVAMGQLKAFSLPPTGREWKKVDVITDENTINIKLDQNNSQTLNPLARKVLQATSDVYKNVKTNNNASEIDHLTLSLNTLRIRTTESDHFIRQASDCFGEEVLFLSNTLGLREVAEHMFKLAKLRLEDVEPVDAKTIKSIYTLLFKSPLQPYSQSHLQDDYHPCWVFERLNEAIMALESGKAELAPKPTIEKPLEEVERTSAAGEAPKPQFAGANGSYYLLGLKGQKLWVMKPAKEEKEGLLTNFKPGDAAKREHLACLLNHDRAYPIPYTAFLVLEGIGVCSVQAYIKGCTSLSVIQTGENGENAIALLPRNGLQLVMHFDIRFNNTDRHNGNILFTSGPNGDALAIDHGGCFPVSPEDPPKLQSLLCPQISEPMHERLYELSINADVELDTEIMRLHGIDERAILRMSNGTLLQRIAVQQSLESKKAGGPVITLYDLGIVMMKHPELLWTEKGKQEYESLCKDIIELKTRMNEICAKDKNVSKIMRLHMQKLKNEYSGKTNDKLKIMCLFGVDPNSSGSSEEVGIRESILFKHVEYVLKQSK